jgi:antitoxin YefM
MRRMMASLSFTRCCTAGAKRLMYVEGAIRWYRLTVREQYDNPVRNLEVDMAISASEARQRLFPLIQQVNNDHEPVRIASRAGDAVLMSAADYDSWQETVYLLRSPENARRLMEAVARDKASRTAPANHTKSIDELEEMAGGQE